MALPGEIDYTINQGDTLGAVSQRYGIDPQTLASYNSIADPNQVQAGQSIKIPPADWRQNAQAVKSYVNNGGIVNNLSPRDKANFDNVPIGSVVQAKQAATNPQDTIMHQIPAGSPTATPPVTPPSYAGAPPAMRAFAPQSQGGQWAGGQGVPIAGLNAGRGMALANPPPTAPTSPATPTSPTIPPGGVPGQGFKSLADNLAQQTEASASTPAQAKTEQNIAAKVGSTINFLKQNAGNSKFAATLAGILDSIGVGLSAYGGVQRPSMAQQRYGMNIQSQLAANQADIAYQQAVRTLPVEAQQQIQIAIASGDRARENAIAQEYGIQPLLLERIKAQAFINRSNITAGLNPGQAAQQVLAGQGPTGGE